MSNVYHASSRRPRLSPASTSRVMRWRALGLLAAVGVGSVGVWWFFRKPAVAPVDDVQAAVLSETVGDDVVLGDGSDVVDTDAVANEGEARMMEPATMGTFDATVQMQAVNGAAANGTAVRSHVGGVYAVSVVGTLPAIDSASTAYEVWYVKPGITDFFSLGELYPREDGKWGMVWTQTDALARHDIEDFARVIVMREPRNGDPAPSSDQVLTAEF